MKIHLRQYLFLFIILLADYSLIFSQSQIEIYTMPGCGRCAYTIEYVKKNNVNFIEYDTDKAANNSKMWKVVQNSKDYKGGSITMPVVVKQGTAYFNIEDLQEFVANLSEKSTISSNTSNNSNTSSVQSGNLTKEQIAEFIKVHNKYRAEVNSDPISWSDELAAYAQAWGDHLADIGCELDHRPYSGEWAQKYGENLFWSSGSMATPASAVESWAEEKPDYDGGVMNNKNFVAGHYTQMIWAKTTKVGCAIVKCDDGSTLVVCNYNPPGNYMGESPLKK